MIFREDAVEARSLHGRNRWQLDFVRVVAPWKFCQLLERSTSVVFHQVRKTVNINTQDIQNLLSTDTQWSDGEARSRKSPMDHKSLTTTGLIGFPSAGS